MKTIFSNGTSLKPIVCKAYFREILLFIILLFGLSSCITRDSAIDNTQTSSKQSISNIGSDTLVNLALAWAEAYMTLHPQVSISVTGGGTGTGISALINQTADIANASRPMKEDELEIAQTHHIDPKEFIVAWDAIAVIVHPENPIQGLTLDQISDIYTSKITNWKEVGGENRPIVLLSRESNSGTYVYFLEHVIRLGDPTNKKLFSVDTLLMPSSEGITAEVRQNFNAIGYDGLGYVTKDVKVLAIAQDNTSSYILPSIASVNNKSYPIARPLYMYTAREPYGIVDEYIRWILQDGQKFVAKLGFIPLQ